MGCEKRVYNVFNTHVTLFMCHPYCKGSCWSPTSMFSSGGGGFSLFFDGFHYVHLGEIIFFIVFSRCSPYRKCSITLNPISPIPGINNVAIPNPLALIGIS